MFALQYLWSTSWVLSGIPRIPQPPLSMNVSVSAASEATLSFNDAQLLLDASKYNDCERLQDVIWNGINVDAQDHSGWTVSKIKWTVEWWTLCKLYVCNCIQVSVWMSYCNVLQALMEAAVRGHADAMSLLISKNADINLRDKVRDQWILFINASFLSLCWPVLTELPMPSAYCWLVFVICTCLLCCLVECYSKEQMLSSQLPRARRVMLVSRCSSTMAHS